LGGLAGIVVPHEATAVARAVEQILGDRKLHKRFSDDGKRAAGALGWDEPVRAMESMYAGLADLQSDVGQSARQP
jgi:hypothetical protein